MKNIHGFYLAALSLLLMAASCQRDGAYYFGDRVFSLTVDIPAIRDVPANNPGQAVLVVTTDAPYWIISAPEWVTPSAVTAPGSVTGTVVSFNIEPNFKSMATSTQPRSGEIKISGGRTSVLVPINQLGHTGWVDPESVIGGIPDMNEFRDFVTAVNDGESPVRWMNAAGEVELQTDLDLSDFGEWVPIGSVMSTGNTINSTAPKGEFFTGVFNGGGHTVRNFKANVQVADDATWGFFGYIDNAIIKNLNFDGVDVTVQSKGKADAGVVVGSACRSTIENVNVRGVIRSAGTTGTQRFALGGIAGFVFSVHNAPFAYDCVIRGCEVNAWVEVDCGSNTANNVNGVMYGGIAGFCTGVKDTPSRVRLENCVNKGSMTVNVGRCSGIAASANCGTILTGCINEAGQLNTFEDGRIGQICCNLGSASAIIDCVNRGDLVTTDAKTTTAAIVALMGDDSVYIEGGDRVANTGTIIGANTRYLSLLCANNNAFNHISNVTLSGKLGRYRSDGKHTMYAVTAGNIMQYIGHINPEYATKITNVTYLETDPGSVPTAGGSIDDLNPVDDMWHTETAGGAVDDLNPVDDQWN